MSAPVPPVAQCDNPLQTIIDSAADLQTALAIFDTHMDGAADELPSSKLFGQIDWFSQQMRGHVATITDAVYAAVQRCDSKAGTK
jgi:hypothetical protein